MTEKIYKRILWFGVAFLAVFSPLWKGGARAWPLTIILLVSYALIFVWLWRINNFGHHKVKRTPIDIPVLLFVMLAIASSFFSIYRHDSFYGLIKLFCYVGIYYLVVNEFDREGIKRILYIVIGMGAILSIYGLLQYLNMFDHSWWNPKDFIAATFVNHNHFSGYLELAIPVTVILAIKKPSSTARRLCAFPALIIMTVVFILAQSRGAWMSLTISFLVMAYMIAKGREGGVKKIFILVLAAIAIISLVYFGRGVISERMADSISADPEGSSFAIRLQIWQGAIDMIKSSPILGAGIGTFIWGYPRYRPEGLNGLVNFAHNDYLETACDMGVPALMVMLWIIVAVIKTGIREENLNSYRLGCAIGVLSLSIHALSDFNFHIPANMLLFTVYLAIIMKVRE
ncbi:MAG: O-antigen ligase family protein [Candidatus Omnitrophica bacterium]|nr:O-antigen ligase family protein [Candidatus Omnitrophota bacterium]MDD5437410.1 O-antigen ligase family protein [Candidatus Omnitrophota bacterium]